MLYSVTEPDGSPEGGYMRLRNIPRAEAVIADSALVVHNPKEQRGSWQKLFGNTNPVHIEVGMGKGQFLTQLAAMHPEINYVGIERYTSVLLRAVEKLEKQEEKPENLLFICMDARELQEVFGEGEVEKIYLNFSDPWPKERHADRRLTSGKFLKRYEQILAPDGMVEFKTDNRGLFDFSMKETGPAGWMLKQFTYDLHGDEQLSQGNVMTEYEEKFSAKGNPICKMIIAPGADGRVENAGDTAAIPKEQ
ncbi:tRNA (guanine-N(7)-)-methyltransferase [Marvinbryantia formatexigens DSM 14469]|uniref:tRNA (guanine-N(7)-)-methyltransferase n=2 Tax=Marvinbryantia TaxID=248744 RepID=C6LI45_9FIRM|nr:tRNA (guanine-N(7)-)-methyltransferase [Marvinbryantia formatexigens DSM 14469]